MDYKEQILLNENRNVDSINVDTTIKISLDSNIALNTEYNINNILDVTQVYQDERQSTTKYRIHGKFEYFSILNGMEKNYADLEYFFKERLLGTENKTIFTDLNIYLVKPSENFISLANNRYIKTYEVIGTQENIDIVRAGFSRNIYNDLQYAFVVNFDVDIRNMVDGLGFPLSELALYVEYKPQQPTINGQSATEIMFVKSFDGNGNTFTNENFNPIQLSVGDLIRNGDVIDYDNNQFLQTDYNLLEHYIRTPYRETTQFNSLPDGIERYLFWKYRPIIPIKLRYFENELRRGNTGSTAYEEVIAIPDYAKSINNEGDVVWRNFLDNGFFDPIDEIGVSFPFINKRHYVFNNITFPIVPFLDDPNTGSVFSEIKFGQNLLDSITPTGDLNNIGDIC